LAFIAGCIPLWTATGAGSVARQIMGTTVIGGMLAASAFGIFFVPAVFYLVERFSKPKVKAGAPLSAVPTSSPSQGAADD
jgi:hydrophobic/amphiphilic exporter-1 (mainly G- bacteria), HAE1 family